MSNLIFKEIYIKQYHRWLKWLIYITEIKLYWSKVFNIYCVYACIRMQSLAIYWLITLYVWSYIPQDFWEPKDLKKWLQYHNQTIFYVLGSWCFALLRSFWVTRYILKALCLFYLFIIFNLFIVDKIYY